MRQEPATGDAHGGVHDLVHAQAGAGLVQIPMPKEEPQKWGPCGCGMRVNRAFKVTNFCFDLIKLINLVSF